MAKYTQEFLEKTIQIWQPSSIKKLSMQDAIEINDNFVALIELMNELEGKYPRENTNIGI